MLKPLAVTVRAIIDCTAASRVKGYPGLVRHYLGPTWGTMFSGVIATYCFFAATAAFIIVKNVITPLVLLASHQALTPPPPITPLLLLASHQALPTPPTPT